jgi:DivIVA domain-containing protein
MIEPADIDHIQFSTTRIREGYDQDEVDAFLDRVKVDYTFALAQLGGLQKANDELRRQLNAARSAQSEAPTTVTPQTPSAVAEKLLTVAQQTADQHVAEARAEADRIVREAGGKAAAVIGEADEAAKKIVSDGYAEQRARLDALQQQHTETSTALDQLVQSGSKIREALSDALTAYDRKVTQT